MQQNQRHYTVGRLIEDLRRCDMTAPVVFDFCRHSPTPTGLRSYRGFYEDAALGWERVDEPPTVATLLSMLRRDLGTTMQGWKGGDYRIDERTALWVANQGECESTAVVGVADHGYRVTIATEEML